MKKLIKFIMILVFACTLTTTLSLEVKAAPVWYAERGAGDEKAEEEMALVDLGYITDKDLYEECCANWYSVGVIQDMLNRGYMSGYIQQLKDGGWIPNDFTPTGASNSGSSNSSTPSTPVEESTPTPSPAVTHTQEEINAAWKENKKVDPTCTKEGYIQYKNSLTGETKKETLEMIDHSYEESDRTEASCIEIGVITYTCSGCGDTYTEETPMIEHSYEESDRIEASCTDDGKKIYKCTTCQNEKEEILVAAGHDNGEWVIITEEGLFTEGLKELRCTKDSVVLASESIPQASPIPLGVVVVILISIIGLVVGIVLIKSKKNK